MLFVTVQTSTVGGCKQDLHFNY